MKRWIVAAVCLVAARVPAEAVQTAAAEPVDTVVMEGIQLQFHRDGPTFGESRPPTFRMDAARGEWAESSQQWNLQGATAVIYREGEQDLLLSAARAFCDLDGQVAELSEGVRLTAGAVVVDVMDLHYDNESGIAQSAAQATMTDGENRMNGKNLLMDTRNDYVELADGQGTIRMAAAQDPPKDGGSSEESASRYESLDLDFDGVMRFNLDGQLDEVNDNVVLVMTGVDAADNLKVTAKKITFEYETESDKRPAIIHLTGGVHLQHASGVGRAETVTVNFSTGDVEFRGNAELSGEAFEGARASVITINLYTKDATLGPGGRIERVKLNDPDADKDPSSAQPRS